MLKNNSKSKRSTHQMQQVKEEEQALKQDRHAFLMEHQRLKKNRNPQSAAKQQDASFEQLDGAENIFEAQREQLQQQMEAQLHQKQAEEDTRNQLMQLLFNRLTEEEGNKAEVQQLFQEVYGSTIFKESEQVWKLKWSLRSKPLKLQFKRYTLSFLAAPVFVEKRRSHRAYFKSNILQLQVF